jgi:biopolymer transport protein ExbB/TolQ
MARLANLFWRSSLVWGLLLSVGLFVAIEAGVIGSPAIRGYLTAHWTSFVIMTGCCAGLVQLTTRWFAVSGQLNTIEEPLLPEIPAGGQMVADVSKLLAHLNTKVGETSAALLPCRLRDALTAIERRGNSDKLDDELQRLEGRTAAQTAAGQTLIKTLLWSLPLAGLLGTVLQIPDALALLTSQPGEATLPKIALACAGALNTTILALGCSLVLAMGRHLIASQEETLCQTVALRAREELAGRFPSQLAIDDPLHDAVERMVQAIVPQQDKLLRRQVELWQATVDEAHDHWTQLSDKIGEQIKTAISGALDTSLREHTERLGVQETGFWTGIQEGLDRISDKLAKQQQELSRHGVILLKVADAAKHVATVEETLNDNLQALAVTQSFQEMFTSLSATLQLLTSRLSALPAESVIELPRGKKSRGQAA